MTSAKRRLAFTQDEASTLTNGLLLLRSKRSAAFFKAFDGGFVEEANRLRRDVTACDKLIARLDELDFNAQPVEKTDAKS